MNILKTIFKAGALLTALVAFAACDETGGNEDSKIPAEGIYIEASATKVALGEQVKFTIYNNGKDISTSGRVYEINDLETIIKNPWTPDGVGTYTFVANYRQEQSVNSVTVVVGGAVSETKYKQRVLGIDFTGAYCGYCPGMTAALKSFEEENPDQLVVVAAHVNVPAPDPLANEHTAEFQTISNIFHAPGLWVNYRTESSQSLSKIKAAVAKELNTYPAMAGISLETRFDEANSRLTVDAGVKVRTTNNYRIVCALLESDLTVAGANESVYNEVLRDLATAEKGDDLGNCEIDSEVTKSFAFDFSGTNWKAENCEVVVWVLGDSGNGRDYYVTNVRACGVNAKAEYEVIE